LFDLSFSLTALAILPHKQATVEQIHIINLRPSATIMDDKMPEIDGPLALRKAQLTSLPPEVLQSIFWLSLELNMCHVSRDLRMKLPSFPRVSLFLTLVGFGPRRLHGRILNSHRADCSDVIAQLRVPLPLTSSTQLALQQEILGTGWLNYGVLMTAFYEAREHCTQARWIEKGYEALSENRQAFDERYKHRKGNLVVNGLDKEGRKVRLLTGEFSFAISDHHPNPPANPIYRARFHRTFRLMDVRCMPEKVLRCPFPWPESSTGCRVCRLRNYSLFESKPTMLAFLWAVQRVVEVTPPKAQHRRLEAHPALVDAAIVRAISAGNTLALEMLLEMEYVIDGAFYSIAITNQHFTIAAQRRDTVSIFTMMMTGHGVIPVDCEDIMLWASGLHEEPHVLGIHGCACLLMDYMDYLRDMRARKQAVECFFKWKRNLNKQCTIHNARFKAKVQGDAVEGALEGSSMDGLRLARLGYQYKEICGRW
jgi:hypothetical protein